jgi:hypothetical protein
VTLYWSPGEDEEGKVKTKLRLGAIVEDKPVRLTLDLPAAVHRDLIAYADLLSRETGQRTEPAKLIAPMLARFMATDRAFAKARRTLPSPPALVPHSDGPCVG